MISKALVSFITTWILSNTEFSEKVSPPEFFSLSQNEMSDKACYSSDNCKVKAYYVKNEGIFFRDNLDPENNICDQSIILHEMIHHYQKMLIEVLILTKKHFGHFKKDKPYTTKIYS